MTKVYKVAFRVYYEDTDSGGVVYYANYLKFAERARTEFLRELGIEQQKLWDSEGLGFMVKSVKVDYHAPARLDDLLTIETQLQSLSAASIRLSQNITLQGKLLAEIVVDIVCINRNLRPARLPRSIKGKLEIL